MPKRTKTEAPWFPPYKTRYIRARLVHGGGRYCVLCRRDARVLFDIKRGLNYWWEAFPICEGCAKQIPEAIAELDFKADDVAWH